MIYTVPFIFILLFILLMSSQTSYLLVTTFITTSHSFHLIMQNSGLVYILCCSETCVRSDMFRLVHNGKRGSPPPYTVAGKSQGREESCCYIICPYSHQVWQWPARVRLRERVFVCGWVPACLFRGKK